MRGYRKYRRYMRKEKRIHRQEKSFHRWLAIFMAAVLLMSESNLTVLAQEVTSGAEVSEEEAFDEVLSEETDADNADDADEPDNEEDSDTSEGADDVEDADEDNTDASGDEEDGAGDINDGNGLPDEDNKDENICVCENRCSEDMVNEDCPVCMEDYVNCIGQENEVSITEDGAAAVADSEDEGIETHTGGDTFQDAQGITYSIVKDDEDDRQVEVTGETRFSLAVNEVKIPENVYNNGSSYRVTSIGKWAFNGCSSLTSIEIPDSVTSIGDWTFTYCSSLTNIKVPEKVTSIGEGAFWGCSSFTSIKIPDSVTSIGEAAFTYCSSLTSIEIPNGVTSIGDRAFSDCNSLTSIEIPDSVISIGEWAFKDCRSLTSIEMPDSIISIGERAFNGCSSLTSIEIPNGVARIDDYTFFDCNNLTSIGIPDSVKSIGDYAFDGCYNLTDIEIPDSVTSIGEYVFANCNSLKGIKIPYGVISIGQLAFDGCYNLTDIEIPDSVTSIGEYAFASCYGLTSIEIPDGVTSISHFTFLGCSSLTKIEIPDGVTSIGSNAFLWCSSLTSIKIPDSVTSIGEGAFDGCEKLSILQIVVPSDGTDIIPPKVGNNVFAGTPDDRSIIFITKDGSLLTGSALEAAKAAYKADNRDGDAADNLWWGWKLGDIADDTYHITYHLDGYEAPEEYCTYTSGENTVLPKPKHSDYDFDGWYVNADYSGEKVTSIGSTETGDKVYYGRWVEKPESAYRVDIKVRRDGSEWENHGRTFMLLSAADGSLTANFETVKQGEYFIYDVTGVPSESLATDGVNTEVRVLVKDKGVEATVDYYTVTFYDGSTAYGDDKLQAMQTVLSGKTAKEPRDPSKEGYRFRQWVTEINGSEVFDFNVPVESRSEVYASWISNAATEYYITAMAGEGGSISPDGNVRVQEGGTQTFEITPDDGYRIKAVAVDGMNRTDELTDAARAGAIRAQAETSRYYTFVDVREDHTIRATFEKESSNGNAGDSGNTGTGGNTGNGGDSGSTGEGDDTGTGGNGGDSDNTGAGGSDGDSNNNDAGDNTVININSLENADGSPAENTNLSTTSGDARVINSNNSSTTNNNTSNPSKDTEPRTGDTTQVEIYATVAMIAGLTYLLLYFADKEKGMTEEKKQELVSSMIGWAKRGRRIRKYVVLVPIFVLLCYYHSIGKRIEVEWDEEPVWAEL